MANLLAWLLLLSAMRSTALADGCRVANVSAGGGFTCAVLESGSARCWGDASNGRLGRPNTTTTSDPNGPPLDFGAGRSVVQLATYAASSCALLDDHTVSCWGSNTARQLGLGDTKDRDQPTQVQLGTGKQTIQLLSTGCTTLHSCAAVKGEGVYCWGSAGDFTGNQLQGTPWLGQPSISDTPDILPSRVDIGPDKGGTLTVLDMCAGADQTCVLSVELGLKCWGSGVNTGELGLGNITDTTDLTGASLPSVNLGTGRSAVQISCGDLHTCAVLDNGAIKCFGYNGNGQLGHGDTVNRGAKNTDMGDSLKPVDVGKGRTVKQVAAGGGHTCVLLDNGQLKCWGDNTHGQLGHHCSSGAWGDSPGQMGDSLPAVDLGPNRTAVSLSAGSYHSCAVLDDGSSKCWGDNTDGGLGIGSGSGCPPSRTVDLGSCTSRTVGGNSTGPRSNSSSAPTPTPLPPTLTPAPTSTPSLPPAAPLPATATPPATTTTPPVAGTRPSSSPSLSTPLQASGSQTPSTSSSSSSSSSQSAPAGVIAGGVIAAVVVAALSGWAVWWWRDRRQSRAGASRTTGLDAKSKQPSAQVVAIASDELAMNIEPGVGAVQSAADIKLNMGTAINAVTDVRDTSNSNTATPSRDVLPEARSTPPLTSTNSHKADARDTSTEGADRAATPPSGMIHQASVDGMRIPWSHITLGGLLGEGGFGKVYKGKWRMNTVAVKVLNMHKTSTAAIDNLHREALIMSELRHPCIARVFGVVDEDPHHALVMQYYQKGTLQKYLTTSGYAELELPAKLHIAFQIASGMQFMHERAVPVLHGDLKTANILLTGPGRSIAIADFGLSQAMLAGQEAAVASGALTYSISPPEVLVNPLAPRTRAADVYAFAIVLLEIYTGLPCFRGLRAMDIRRLVIGGKRPPLPADMPPCIADIIKACWSQDPASRPSFTDVVEQLSAAAAELHMDGITDGTVTAVTAQTMTDWLPKT